MHIFLKQFLAETVCAFCNFTSISAEFAEDDREWRDTNEVLNIMKISFSKVFISLVAYNSIELNRYRSLSQMPLWRFLMRLVLPYLIMDL